jgi:hypothetical protein
MNAWTAADMRDAFNERAGISEYDAGLDRLTAEAEAMREVIEMVTVSRKPATNKPRTANRRDPEVYRAYQRELMRRRRADKSTRPARVVHA